MTKFYGQRTCTLNIKEQLPNNYHDITHETIAELLHNEGILSKTDTIQISTCRRYASMCFTTREILEDFCKWEYELPPDQYVSFEPDYHSRIRISIENIPIELPDKEVRTFLSEFITIIGTTYFPGTRFHIKHFTTGTRVYQGIKLQKHLPRYLYQFKRHLRIRYDSQPKNIITEQLQDLIEYGQSENLPQTTEDETQSYNEDLQKDQLSQQTDDNETQSLNKDVPPEIDIRSPDTQQETQQETSQQEIQKEIQQQIQIEIPEPRGIPQYAKKSFNWWRSPVNEEIKEPKYDINPNKLYHNISEEDRQKYYEPETEEPYGAPLLKPSEIRMPAILRK